MSQQNHFQPWKQNSLTPQNITTNNNLYKINYQSATHIQDFHQQQIEPANNKNKISNIHKVNENVEKYIGTDCAVSMVTADGALNDECDEIDVRKKEIMQQIDENVISDGAKQQILQIMEKISILRPHERLLLYLQMPGGPEQDKDPLKQTQNPLGSRSEINQTINWVRSHLEHDPNVSIPKQEVYEDYVAYCARVEIKPLSTADFGKVMKQVFPGVRPRRLGTRGHSRYCYAAMRKATKLDAPRLPNLLNKKPIPKPKKNEEGGENTIADTNNDDDEEVLSEEDSWKIIKKWADTMLNSKFNGLADLAKFITKNNLNSPAIISTQQMIQKKIMQRELKEKQKLANAAMKKRRKKRKKTVSTSSSATDLQNLSTNSKDDNTSNVIEKNTVNDTNSNALIDEDDNDDEDEDNSQLLPINLTNNEHQGTNLACDKTIIPNDKINNSTILPIPVPAPATPALFPQLLRDIKIEVNTFDDIDVSTPTTSAFITGVIPLASPSNSSNVNANVDDEILSQNIICKKVRQAQQSKSLLQQQQIQQTQPQMPITMPIVLPTYNFQHPENVKMPKKSQTKINYKRHLPQQNKNNKKGKFKQPKQQQHTEKATTATASKETVTPPTVGFDSLEPNDLVLKKDDPDFVLPRERYISICNMDKNALDDYLFCEENSQDQEAELLQYFPEEVSKDKQQPQQKKSETATVPIAAASVINKFSSYESVECKIEKLSDTDDSTNENLLQLRKLLEQNITNSSNSATVPGKLSLPLAVPANEQNQNVYPVSGGSASASLTMLSQRHLSHIVPTNNVIGNSNISNTNAKLRNFSSVINNNNNSRKFSDIYVEPTQIQQTPNPNIAFTNSTNINDSIINNENVVQNQCSSMRRKNYSFVPIPVDETSSQLLSTPQMLNNNNPNLKSHNIVESPFVSPRTTPVIKKNCKVLNNLTPIQIMPNVNASGTTHYKSDIMQAQSAPPSPSLIQNYHSTQGLNFPPVYNSQQSLQQAHHHPLNHQHSHPHSPIMNPESRCRSVPLHSLNYSNYSPAAYNSVPHNPAPSDYAEFSESHINDIINDTTSGLQSQTIKIESNTISDFLNNNNSNPNNSSNDLLNFSRTNNFSSISRSVPSTPLPMHCYNNNNVSKINNGNAFDMAKSVPTTPNGMTTNLFRYSPETSRDFLINGNSVERVTSSSVNNMVGGGKLYFQNQIPFDSINVGTSTAAYATDNMNILSEGIEGLSNLDSDQIIGSDILSNL